MHLFSERAYNGVVVDLGAGMTQISPVSDGYTSQHCCKGYKIAGNAVDESLQKLLLAEYNQDIIDGERIA